MAKGITWEITENIEKKRLQSDLLFKKYIHGEDYAPSFTFSFKLTLNDLYDGVIRSSERNDECFGKLTSFLESEFIVPLDALDNVIDTEYFGDDALINTPMFNGFICDFFLHSGYRLELEYKKADREASRKRYLAYPL
jgi:hypothetical protein